jgi:hypothetical protein
MRIANLNPDTDIGASSWFVDIDDHRILLDAGMHPKREGREGLPLYKAIQKEDLDAIAVSHCHHDHVGTLPVALRYFPKAHVVLPEQSYFIIERVLHNSVNVMTRQRTNSASRIIRSTRTTRWTTSPRAFKDSATIARSNGPPTRNPNPVAPPLPSNSTMPAIRSAPRASCCAVKGNFVLHRRRLFPRSNHPARRPVRGCESRCAHHGNHARQQSRGQRRHPRDGSGSPGRRDPQGAQAQRAA